MIGSERKRLALERCLMVMVGCCILAYLGIFAIINLRGFARYCDSDMYADTLIAKKMWEQKTLFPENWIFSNQYFVVATPVLTALFYGLTGNVNTAMALATEVMTVLILLSFLWLLRAATKDLLLQLTACLLLTASVIAPDGPLNLNIQLFFVQASFYACYLITMFVVFGDYVRAFQTQKPRVCTWVLCLVLSFATGMQSLRQTVVMVLPILAYELFLALRRMLQKRKPWERANIGTLIRALSYATANLAGVMLTGAMDIPHTSLFGGMQPISPRYWGHRLGPVWTAVQEITALDYAFNREYSPLFAVLCFFLLLLFLAAGVLWLLRIRKPEGPLEAGWLLCLVGIFGVCLSSVVLNIELRPIYIFMWYPLAALSGLIVLKKLPFWPKCVTVLLACVLSLGSLWYSHVPYAGMALWKGPSDAQLMCDWAMEEGYEYVYGSWFVSPRVAAHSGGALEAGYWDWLDPLETLRYNVASDIYDEEDNAKAIYVFTDKDEETCLNLAREQGVALTFVAEFGDYRAYTSPVPLMEAPVPD